MQLEGMLGLFPLTELMAMILSSSVTGVLEIGECVEGQIFCRDGRPYHAIAGKLVGLDAVNVLFEIDNKPFRFIAGITCPIQTIYSDPWDLITSAQRQAEMWAQMRAHIPSLDWVPKLCDSKPNGQVHIGETVWPILAAVDGQRSVSAIAEFIGQVPVEVGAALHQLILQGVVRIEPPQPASKPQPPVTPSTTRGFLDRLMTSSTLE